MSNARTLQLLYRNNFKSFYRLAFRHAFEGKRLLDNWHIDHLLGVLNDCLEGKTTRAIINAPPRHSKSFLASVAYPLFALGQNPSLKIMVLTANKELALELESLARRIMGSNQMPAVFAHLAAIARQPKLRLSTGGELSYGVFGKPIVGRGIDIVIIDDPISPDDALNDRFRTDVNEWFKSDLLPRISDRSSNVIVVAMQRLHPDDLTGMLLRSKGEYRHCEFAAIARKDEQWPMPDGSTYTRRKGEVLHPDKMSREQLLTTLDQMGAVQFSAQYQQDPSIRKETRTGHYFLREYDQSYYDTWTPESGIEQWAICLVPEVDILRFELFGEGPPPPEPYVPRLTEAQWEQAAILQQRRLVESMKEGGSTSLPFTAA